MLKKVLVLGFMFLFNIVTLSFASSFNMTYIYGGTVNTQINNVKNTNGIINEVSPSYFDINEDGTLKLTDSISSQFILKMHEMNIKVVPFLSNHWNKNIGINALNNADEISTQIANAIEKYDLDGVNVDIENVSNLQKDLYTNLVRLLREKIDSNKSLVVSVCANPNGWTTGWHGSYDYKNLAKYADYLMIMTYDEHYEGGVSGSVASYEFIENSIRYALKYVDSEKIVLGLPFFGRYWNENDQGGRGVSNRLIKQILDDYNTIGVYDEKTKSMKATITVSEEQALNDKYTFSAGTYTFWYEDDYTLKEKIKLIEKYNLKGSGSWALGQELTSIWDKYIFDIEENNKEKEEMINNVEKENIYDDIVKDRWSYNYIKFAKDTGVMIGNNNKFRPSSNLTRAEAVTIINRVIKLKGIKCEYISDKKTSLSDIYNHWAYNDINECVSLGLIKGYEDGTFRPDEYITREEIVVILSRINFNIENKVNNVYFTDINKELWSYTSIVNSVKMGLIKGYNDNTFRPKNNITREEISSIIYNICK